MGRVMDVQFDADLERIWALCDNTCSVSSTLLKVNATGAIVPDVVYARPAGLPNVNIEGFAIAPDSTCVDGFKEAIWSDDGISAAGHEGHALYSGTFPCGLDLDLDQTIDFPALPNTSPIGTVSLHADRVVRSACQLLEPHPDHLHGERIGGRPRRPREPARSRRLRPATPITTRRRPSASPSRSSARPCACSTRPPRAACGPRAARE